MKVKMYAFSVLSVLSFSRFDSCSRELGTSLIGRPVGAKSLLDYEKKRKVLSFPTI
jgi:hypothetical protein